VKTFGLWVAVCGWHDGDTFYGVLDQGFNTVRAGGMLVNTTVDGGVAKVTLEPIRHRIYGINAPELKAGALGRDATVAAQQFAPPGIYAATSYHPDDFGRPIVDLVLPDGGLFSQRMLAGGFAVPYVP
jgi:endonuclease YncB( thermonuclease family)